MIRREMVRRRAEIDQLDAELVRLLNRRTELARQIGTVKSRFGLPILDLERELEVLGRVRRHNRGPLDERSLIRIYRGIIREARSIQKQNSERRQRA